MKLQFLWDEEKTRKLFRTHLILFTVGGVMASAYTLLLPPGTPYHLYVTLIPIIFTLSCGFYLLTLKKPNPYIKFLIFTLEGQLAASIFMALTGGFLGIVQFAPYMFLLFAVFELGVDSTVVLGVFSVLTFLGILAFSLIHNQFDVLQNFFYYVGSYILIVVVERNIGKELSIQFEAKKKLEEVDDLKNQFITLASHYLRTPLTVIKGVSSMMNNPMLKDSVKQLELLTEKLLAIAEIEKGRTKIFETEGDMRSFLESMVMEFQVEALRSQVTLQFRSAASNVRMKFDAIKLKEAIGQLIDNSIRYNKPGGLSTVSLSELDKRVLIEIKDTGRGIEKEQLGKLFTTFNRGGFDKSLEMSGAGQGMGLSLYLSKLIIEAHGGTISVVSEINQGTSVSVILPKV